jgi:S1-C subfamily serine protease
LAQGSGRRRGHRALADRVEDAVVRIYSSKKSVDKSAPWQFEETSQQSYLGVVLSGGRVLTTAYAVADAAFLEIQRFGASRREEAEVEFVDYEVNLALIKPVAEAALAGLKPALLGDDLAIDDQVDLYKARDAYQLSRMPGSLQEVGLYGAVTSSYSLVSYLFKVQQTELGWSEPVFRQGQLVALTTGQDQNFVHALPLSLIRHFLADHLDKDYRGFPSMGVQLSSLVSPDMRRLVGADKVDHGIRVAEVLPGGSFVGKLQTDDVILEVDGETVSEHGFVTHPKWGKVHLKYLINRHYAGDPLRLKILRRGQELLIEARLVRFDSNRAPVVAYRYGQPEPHLIFGGLVFQELSEDYLKQWGRDWRAIAPYDLLYAFEFGNKPVADPKTRIIFVARVLSDAFNRGYDEARHQIVDTVNGAKVTSMDALRDALRRPVLRAGRAYARIKFLRDGGEAILAYDGLSAAEARIARAYEVKTPASFYSPPAP